MRHRVIHLNSLFKGLELEDVDNRSEYLVLNNGCIVVNSDDGWHNVVAGAFNLLATVQDLASLLFDLFESIHVIFDGLLGVEGSDQSAIF